MSRIVLAGGGIGGLATAIGLARSGHEVVLAERADAFGEVGAGIQLAPNGLRALTRLGVGDAVRRCAVNVDELRFMDGMSGDHVAGVPLTQHYQDRFGNPYVVIHRAELHDILLRECRRSRSITLLCSTTAVGYEQDARSAGLLLDNGERLTGDAVIGADGINSAIRRQMVADGEPRLAGITVYRSILEMDRVPAELRSNAVTWWAGPRCHFVHYPIAGGRLLNLAASSANGASEAFASVAVDAPHVQSEFAMLASTPRRLIDLGNDWKAWSLVDREPIDSWTDMRVALVGDAAHPMLHYAAQGACMALEDAVVLGEMMRAPSEDIVGRLTAYNAARRIRTARIQRLAVESIALWHPAGQSARIRNAALSTMSENDFHDRLAGMHGAEHFDGTDPAAWIESNHVVRGSNSLV